MSSASPHPPSARRPLSCGRIHRRPVPLLHSTKLPEEASSENPLSHQAYPFELPRIPPVAVFRPEVRVPPPHHFDVHVQPIDKDLSEEPPASVPRCFHWELLACRCQAHGERLTPPSYSDQGRDERRKSGHRGGDVAEGEAPGRLRQPLSAQGWHFVEMRFGALEAMIAATGLRLGTFAPDYRDARCPGNGLEERIIGISLSLAHSSGYKTAISRNALPHRGAGACDFCRTDTYRRTAWQGKP